MHGAEKISRGDGGARPGHVTRGAPVSRRALCRLDAIPDPGSRGFAIGTEAGTISLFLVRAGGTVAAYENSCPHTGGPLDWVPGRFLTREKDRILCATHGALFRIADGACLSGPCAGERLRALPVSIADGMVAVDL